MDQILAEAGIQAVLTGIRMPRMLCGPARHHHLICQVCRLVIERSQEKGMEGIHAEEILYRVKTSLRRL
ncbi:hypothetical protein [Nonomuraea africana]|uniref:Fe2+ or Zn2+ uptake regulation protein n=1 Tax=Nonomuraea africana TaxID=46171 RepID=A0ABR9K6X8_9ACTN|nr:hypothetical protein [Nonomuraea africana]MBE1557550.1 Fe2+ or Zn2+ uptake regulation protein [Nonomuraea africana]